MAFQVIEKTRRPSSSISWRGCRSVHPIPTRSPRIQPSPRASPLQSCRPIASCTDASFSAVFRYAQPDIRGLARRSILLPSYLRPAALLGLRPFAGLLPRTGDFDISAEPGPRVVFAPRVRPDLFSSGDRSPRRGPIGRGHCLAFDFWASLPSAIRVPQLTVSHAERSCLGLCLLQGSRAHIRASDRARPRSHHWPPGSRGPLFVARNARPYPLMGLGESRRPFSVLRGRCLASLNGFEGRYGPTPCMRFCTVREKEMIATSRSSRRALGSPVARDTPATSQPGSLPGVLPVQRQ
jgi:hypothetical protein